jgi:tRNA threonylcarbamoyladenosine biosynthesis protein TsaB
VARRILAIDSATDSLSVALLHGEEVIALRESEARMQHAAALLPAIDATLKAAGSDLDAIEALGISTGPGSFTSLRIGLATAKGLAFRRELDAVGVSTLESMALAGLEQAEDDAPVVALLDARRGEWYAGGWRAAASPGGLPVPMLAEGLYAPDRIAAALTRTEAIRVVAPDNGAWLEAFEAAEVEVVGRVEGADARPSAQWVGRLAQLRLSLGEGRPAGELRARYLRRAEAEAKLLGGPVESGEVADLGGLPDPA